MILKTPISICGQGSASARGASLFEPSPIPPEEMDRCGGRPGKFPVYRVDLKQPCYLQWQQQPRLRRASPVSLFMAEAARQALEGRDVDRAKLGIVAAYSGGALIYTRKFFTGVVQEGQRFASPMLFPETVFNSPTSHLASILGVQGPSYSVVGDGSAWINAIGIAACWLALGRVREVLVVGAEEFDSAAAEAYIQARWLRRASGFVPSEGAGAILLRLADPADRIQILGISEGHTFRNKTQAAIAARLSLSAFPGVRHVSRTSQHSWFEPIEKQVHAEESYVSHAPFAYLGEAFAASAAWRTLQALPWVAQTGHQCVLPIWGLSQQCASLLLGTKLLS